MLKKFKFLNFLDTNKSESYRNLQAILPAPDAYIEIRISRKLIIAIVLSMLVHILALYFFNHQTKPISASALNARDDTLNVELTQPAPTKAAPQIPSPPAHAVPPPQPVHANIARPVHRQPVRHHVLTAKPVISSLRHNRLSIPVTPQPTPSPSPAEAPNSSAPTDMSSYINMVRARKQAESGEPAAPPSADDARMARIKQNLKPQGGGGVFQIIHVGTETAEFTFRGWGDSTYTSPMRQTIDVKADANTDVEHAIVRKMIAIIRERHPGYFTWESYRLGRTVTLSAKPEDNAGLEDFLLKEFFYNNNRAAEQ